MLNTILFAGAALLLVGYIARRRSRMSNDDE